MAAQNLTWARVLTGATLGFHIVFATLGVGMPLFILVALVLAAWRQDPDLALLARRWIRAMVVLVVTGAASGTLIGLDLYIFWPQFMAVAGRVIILPLVLEGFAFFMEAAALSLYLYRGERLSAGKQVALWVPVTIGAGASGFLITTMNAFMNAPAGFLLMDGQPTAVRPWAALFNLATPTETAHVLVTAYLTTGAILAATAALSLLRGSNHRYFRKAVSLSVAVTAPLSLAAVYTGDQAGKFLAMHQPEKLAALEGLIQTTRAAPEVLFGWFSPRAGQLVGGLRLPVPGLLSYLATGRFDATIQGLRAFPPGTWPPLVVHDLFDAMVAIGFYLVGAILADALPRWRHGAAYHPSRARLWLLAFAGPLAMLAVELGWVAAEEGRQPWLIYGLMTDRQGVTTAHGLPLIGAVYLPLYVALVVVTVLALRATFRRYRLHIDPETDRIVEFYAGTPPAAPQGHPLAPGRWGWWQR